MKKRALITGITGQDGTYLAQKLLSENYEVHGIIRRSSHVKSPRVQNLLKDTELHFSDMTDPLSIANVLGKVAPNEIYNLAAQSDVGLSFSQPKYTYEVNAVGTLNLLEAIRSQDMIDFVKFYQASTSELFGKVLQVPQNENTPFYPRSPYGTSKLAAHWSVINYREGYGLFGCNGILFNHESPRRGEDFVTRKITLGLARIRYGLQQCLYLGNLDAKRDWGHAKDYVEMQWLMLQQDKPDDFVIASGKQHSVKEFTSLAALSLGMKIEWQGEGINQVAIDGSGKVIVKVDPKLFRANEVQTLLGDSQKAREKLNWTPKISLPELVNEMVENDILIAKNEADGHLL